MHVNFKEKELMNEMFNFKDLNKNLKNNFLNLILRLKNFANTMF